MARDLDSLVRLQSALTGARIAREQLDGVPESMRELHDEHQDLSQVIETLRAQIQEAELGRRTAEAAADDVQVRLARFQEHVNRVSTQREYGSLLSEIDTAKAELSLHEEEALAAIERGDESTSELESRKDSFEELDARRGCVRSLCERSEAISAMTMLEPFSQLSPPQRNQRPTGTPAFSA